MTRRALSFRARLTLRWTFTFALLLACAELAIYQNVGAYVRGALDSHARALAATEAASATDGPQEGVHLHEYQPSPPLADALSGKLVQVYDASGRLLRQSALLGREPPFVPPALIAPALRGEAPIVSVVAAGRPARVVLLGASRDGQQYVIAAGSSPTRSRPDSRGWPACSSSCGSRRSSPPRRSGTHSRRRRCGASRRSPSVRPRSRAATSPPASIRRRCRTSSGA